MAEEYEYRAAWEIARALGMGNPEKIEDLAEKKRFKNELGGRVLQVLRDRGYLVGQNMLTEKGQSIARINFGRGKAKDRPIVVWKFNETVALLDDIRPATRAELTALKDEIATLRRELLAAITSTVINLDAKDQALFANALINPPEPNAALRRLWDKHAPSTNSEQASKADEPATNPERANKADEPYDPPWYYR